MKEVSEGTGDQLAKLFHENSKHLEGINGKDFVRVRDFEYWTDIFITVMEVTDFESKIGPDVLAWTDRRKKKEHPESQIMILKNYSYSAEDDREIYKTDEYGGKVVASTSE